MLLKHVNVRCSWKPPNSIFKVDSTNIWWLTFHTMIVLQDLISLCLNLIFSFRSYCQGCSSLHRNALHMTWSLASSSSSSWRMKNSFLNASQICLFLSSGLSCGSNNLEVCHIFLQSCTSHYSLRLITCRHIHKYIHDYKYWNILKFHFWHAGS